MNVFKSGRGLSVITVSFLSEQFRLNFSIYLGIKPVTGLWYDYVYLTPFNFSNPIPFIPFPLLRGRGISCFREASPLFDSPSGIYSMIGICILCMRGRVGKRG